MRTTSRKLLSYTYAFIFFVISEAFVRHSPDIINLKQKNEFSSRKFYERKTHSVARLKNGFPKLQMQDFDAASYPGSELSWLVKERDACGVGFIANIDSKASHEVVQLGTHALGCMEHRGACLSDNISGDGSGIMTAIPWDLIEAEMETSDWPARENRGLAMVFLPKSTTDEDECMKIIEREFSRECLRVVGWRTVPTDDSYLGRESKENQPSIKQLVIACAAGKSGDDLERLLYLRRRMTTCVLLKEGFDWHKDMYFCSVSTRVVVYKGMTNANALKGYYPDLTNVLYKTNFCVYHRRFSTNTMPRWPLAQPMRMLGHNGEINTLLGNINWVRAREGRLGGTGTEVNDAKMTIETLNMQDESIFDPLVDNGKSDSSNFDSMFEIYVESGKLPMEALMVLVPEAYRGRAASENEKVKDFYRFWEAQQEPWDGPALLVWSDGKKVGACLDRNGLRPARYFVTKSGKVCMMSETGVVPVDEADILEKGRLGPGQMIACNLETSKFLRNDEIKQLVASRRPYGEWINEHMVEHELQQFDVERKMSDMELLIQQAAFGWSSEDVDMQIADMAGSGKETTFCMGDDIPLAVLSEKPHVLYDYFKQRFAQVTNPPIDPLREGAVMSVEMFLGRKGNPMKPTALDARQLHVKSPILNERDLEVIRSSTFKTVTLSTLYDLSAGPGGLEKAVERLGDDALRAVESGAEVIILSDMGGLGSDLTYIPPLLATGAVHHKLIARGRRMDASLIMETGQAWSTHHLASLIGYGASALHPYLALEAVKAWQGSERVQMRDGKLKKLDPSQVQENFRSAMENGLLKVMSKMGISLLSSYQGAQIFEAIGIGEDLLQLGFKGTPSRLGGISVQDLANETALFVKEALSSDEKAKLKNYGYVQFMRSGEYHHNSPLLMKTLHNAIKAGPGAYDQYELYMRSVRERPLTALRDLFELNFDRNAIPVEEVEPASKIMAKFCTGGMSLGALSREAHETLAIGMNRIAGKSNSGEGGEDPMRFKHIDDVDSEGNSPTYPHLKGLRNGDLATSAIKQVASGRFGVTPEYLMSAKQIEIKMAQGAKPGEGGQLPGAKVDAYIAGLRSSKPGVTLISPPPHHDIYSIEDLAQLIYDLHQINKEAGVSVKLVSEIGIGTVAAGVAKANADIIQISGHDGGTGASPLSSIKHAGSPWELGLTEVHRTLLENGLRDRTLLRVDGGLKTGWDVLIAALLGAEEYGFGTIAMIAEGCIMARICHTNNCPVGITTQKEKLRKRFPGTPDNIVTFFQFIAEELRLLMAKMGYRTLNELVGRADLLKPRSNLSLAKSDMLKLRFLTDLPDVRDEAARKWLSHGNVHSNGSVLDDKLLANPLVSGTIENAGRVMLDQEIRNTDRSVCARISGQIARKWGNRGFKLNGGEIRINFHGSAGQSFGAFLVDGMTLNLTGEANDYVGKGMNGGTISVSVPPGAGYAPSDNVIVGNTCLYGATGGSLFVQGRVGERFGVRNSGALAVVEGAGDHMCEYMTGGVIVALGSVGYNVGAGMTGGIAYVLDQLDDGSFLRFVNQEIVKVQKVPGGAGEEQLKSLIEKHVALTGSAKGKEVLDRWAEYLPKFWQLVPPAEADSPVAAAPANVGTKETIGAL